MTITQYCNLLGWNASMLAGKAEINYRSAYKAMNSEPVANKVAVAVCKAFSEALERKVLPGEVEGLVIKK